MINIVVVDDQHLILTSLCAMLALNDNFTIQAQVSDSAQAVETIAACKPDVLLLDIRMPKVDGLQILAQLNQAQLHVRTLVLTTFDEHELVLKCLKLGASGYLRKDVTVEELTTAIEAIHAGKQWIQPAVTQQLKANMPSVPVNIPRVDDLTDGEVQILRLIAAGFSNNEIATSLHKSPGRVRNVVTSILDKLQARDRTQAALKALELGLV